MTPGRTWLSSKWSANRASICRALKINPSEAGATYATAPFVVLRHDETNWIAGAIGIWGAFKPSTWSVDQILAVILWNPKTGELRLLNEDAPALVTPCSRELRMTVYADGFAFFRAWADQRAATLTRIRAANGARHATFAEPTDSDIPGALAIGDLDKIDWRLIEAPVLVAGPGTDARKLNRAILRSARLPRVESMAA